MISRCYRSPRVYTWTYLIIICCHCKRQVRAKQRGWRPCAKVSRWWRFAFKPTVNNLVRISRTSDLSHFYRRGSSTWSSCVCSHCFIPSAEQSKSRYTDIIRLQSRIVSVLGSEFDSSLKSHQKPNNRVVLNGSSPAPELTTTAVTGCPGMKDMVWTRRLGKVTHEVAAALS